jgi:hypothetical protein
MKGEQLADFSVATVWLCRGDHCFLLDVWRQRVDYPELRRAVLRLREQHPNATLLIEDKGSGTSLIQDLRASNVAVIGINPQGDKQTASPRSRQSSKPGPCFFQRAHPGLALSRLSSLASQMSDMMIRWTRLLRPSPGSNNTGKTRSDLLCRLSIVGPVLQFLL